MPIEPQTYWDFETAKAANLSVNGPCENDGRGCIPQILNTLQGAYTDDDTDIEFVTIHALMEHGLDLTYPQIAAYWQKYVHITVNGSDALWFANRVARENMDAGMLPPATGSKQNNEFWWTIDPQLVNELWSVIYPGMLRKAVRRATWGAHITSDGWGTHPTRFYAALYSAAFFTTDVQKLYAIGFAHVPKRSPFRRALADVRRWHKDHPDDWRTVWQSIKTLYGRYPADDCGEIPWNCAVSAMINGALGAMAFLYGEGDFKKTVGIAIAAGFDCDNQAATLAGLLGVMHGGSSIPRDLTHEIAGNSWAEPFNNKYVNQRRPPLDPEFTNSEIVDMVLSLTERAIHAHGGEDLGDAYRFKVPLILT
ncbi:unnamed protein product [Symbiodinium natans]|uniref:ADP-ribosylglycohydrolase family protein n=1 Tax=Symbiodinium natans TaxID=878477 RepID=A0A812UVK2_9DINO|nr:unnamed protein product [Symbiodinium natans]